MLKEITIKNFKSIANDTIELGRVNVFIGENGCGKSNILEAVGFASAALEYNEVDNESVLKRGVRIAKPSLIVSNFKSTERLNTFTINLQLIEKELTKINFRANNKENIYEEWEVSRENKNFDKVNEPQEIYESRFEQIKQVTEKASIILKNFFNDPYRLALKDYLIYCLTTPGLRGFTNESRKEPLGIYGEGLDILIASFDEEEIAKLKSYQYLISWLDDFFIDVQNSLKFKGYKSNRSTSTLYFVDKHMPKDNNIFSLENANEGILHVLFYLAAMISKRTPQFFAIDNIESCLNPHLCRHLMEEICKLAKSQDKQLLITTHNPAILDGLNLFDDEIRLFEVNRTDKGYTKTTRIKVKPEIQSEMGRKYKLSELWTRGFLGTTPDYF